MSLDEFSAGYLQDGEPVVSVEAGLVYFVHDGRNAWHNTWVQRYEKGCISQTLDAATEYCEERRKNGSVFYIGELPAIVFNFYYGKLFVVQINTEKPFYGYMNISEECPSLQCPEIKIPSTINEVVSSADTLSGSWDPLPGDSMKVFCLWSFDPYSEVVPIPQRPLQKIKSKSYGTGYYLGWSEKGVSSNPVCAIEAVEKIERGMDFGGSVIQSLLGFKNTKIDLECPHVNAAAGWAFKMCGRLTKAYGTHVSLRDVARIDEMKHRVDLRTNLKFLPNLKYEVVTDDNADVVLVNTIT